SEVRRWLRHGLTVALLVAAVVVLVGRRHQLVEAGRMLGHLNLAWLGVALVLEGASMVVFARLQWWLLRAGGVTIGLGTMVEITLAGNAMGTSLPGGAAWSASWAYGQLRRRGADRVLAGWVILVAGALGSFALFVVVAAGAFVAGSRGPVAGLRPVAAALAAIPVAAGVLALVARRSPAVSGACRRAWSAARGGPAPIAKAAEVMAGVFTRLQLVKPGARGWTEAFGLALANWLDDAACLAACMLALGVHIPWRGVLVAYGLTQIAASLPVTPGGIGVVEGSLAALLVGYGVPAAEAMAVTLLYRLVSFWGLVPVGWGAWAAIELAQRRGVHRRSHPWAPHGSEGATVPRQGPERLMPPQPCPECDEAERAAERYDGAFA
ncbi:MAG TPA: YbhN family protein, partial [Acidimicrobiales bacterium]|nr:YbhN family protein [Acidimicrobiales bacterium]